MQYKRAQQPTDDHFTLSLSLPPSLALSPASLVKTKHFVHELGAAPVVVLALSLLALHGGERTWERLGAGVRDERETVARLERVGGEGFWRSPHAVPPFAM